MSEPQIHVNVQTGTTDIFRIIATILLFGGAGAIAWSVAQGRYAELAATGMSMMIVMMVRLMYNRGLVQVPVTAGGGDDFAATKATLSQISSEYRAWLAGTSMPALALISILYAIGFLLLRAAVSMAMSVFSNVYIAGGAAAMLGAIVVFPTLIPQMIGGLRRKGVVTTPEPAPLAAVQPVQSTVPTSTPVPPLPTTEPVRPAAPDPSPAPRVVRRVTKKEH